MNLTLDEVIRAIENLSCEDRIALYDAIYHEQFTKRINSMPVNQKVLVNQIISDSNERQL